MRVVKTRSIPNVDTDRLRDSIAQIHRMVHTPEGLHEWDAPRRGLYNYGMKALTIKAEITRRGESTGVIGCRYCTN